MRRMGQARQTRRRSGRPARVLALLALLLLSAAPSAAQEKSTLLLLSESRAHFGPLVAELRARLPRPLKVLDFDDPGLTRNAAVWALRSESTAAVVAVGSEAVDLAHRRTPGDRPLVALPYGDALSWHDRHLVLPTVAPFDETLPLLRKNFPRSKRLSVLYWSPQACPSATATSCARSQGFTLHGHRIDSWRSLRNRVNEALETCDLLWLPLDPKLASVPTLETVLRKALVLRRPVLTYSRRIVRGGALACPVHRPADLVDEVLRWLRSDDGARRSWRPRKPGLSLHVNESVAAYLGLSLKSAGPPAAVEPAVHGTAP